MSKSKKQSRDRGRPPRAAEPADTSKAAQPPGKPAARGQVVFRESVEAVAIAFILAFLVRTFEAEAFVIPTGSMATTLMGRHKDVTCTKCGYPYRVSASRGVDAETGEVIGGDSADRCTCPMCHFQMPAENERDFNGDRILVNKFVYCFNDPDRWDVAVFKYPEGAKTNFIKRIVGLPNETLKISHGDLFVRPEGEEEFTIARKSPKKLRGMLKTVYDNDYVLPEDLLAQGWPARWQPDSASSGWTVADDHRSFSNDGAAGGEQWLRYRHYVPSNAVWEAIERGQLRQPRHELITDFCAYNAGVPKAAMGRQPRSCDAGFHWVGDLAVSCTVDARGKQGQVVLELVEGGRRMQCRIDVATGKAELGISGESMRATAATPLVGPGTHEVMFANVDDELTLWVDGQVMEFDGPTTYGPLGNTIPTPDDLEPVGIATVGADVEVSHIKVLRDVYYIAIGNNDDPRRMFDYIFPYRIFDQALNPGTQGQMLHEFFSDPRRWPEAYADDAMRTVEFTLDDDQFLALGDNSAQSKDSRLWGSSNYYVDRDLLIGKALFIYWPHSWDQVSIGDTDIPFPFFPNVKRMEFVR